MISIAIIILLVLACLALKEINSVLHKMLHEIRLIDQCIAREERRRRTRSTNDDK